MKTRTEFVREYAARSRLTAPFADLGLLDFGGGRTRVALPCGCGDDFCEGWTMLSADMFLDYLERDAPEPLRAAYREVLNKWKVSDA